MSAYLVANFELTKPKAYKAYVPAVIPTLQAHGADILVADTNLSHWKAPLAPSRW